MKIIKSGFSPGEILIVRRYKTNREMIRTISFISILVFALVFIASLMWGEPDGQYCVWVNDIGQLGLGISIGVYMIAAYQDRRKRGN